MALKASIFEDTEAFEKLAADPTPTEAKKLGRSVNDFSQQKWDKLVLRVVVDALYWKFTNNEEVKAKLIATGDRMLADASIFDKLWGIGLDVSHADVDSPSRWKGCNVLGYALMIVRNLVRTDLPAPWIILEEDKSGGNSTPSQTRGCGVSLHLPHFNSSSQRPPAFSFVNETGLRDTSGITTATPQTLGKRARGVCNPQAHSNPQLASCPDDEGTRSTTNQLMPGELAHDAQHCENTTWGNPAGGSVIPTQHTSNSASDSRAHRQPLQDASTDLKFCAFFDLQSNTIVWRNETTGDLQPNVHVSTSPLLLSIPQVPAKWIDSVYWWPALDVLTGYLYWQPHNAANVFQEWHQSCWELPVEYLTSLGTTPSVIDIARYINTITLNVTTAASLHTTGLHPEDSTRIDTSRNVPVRFATLNKHSQDDDEGDRKIFTSSTGACDNSSPHRVMDQLLQNTEFIDMCDGPVCSHRPIDYRELNCLHAVQASNDIRCDITAHEDRGRTMHAGSSHSAQFER